MNEFGGVIEKKEERKLEGRNSSILTSENLRMWKFPIAQETVTFSNNSRFKI